SGPKNAKLAIVGIAPASEEMATGVPFMGAAGRLLNEALKENNVSREQVYVTNLLTFPIKVGVPVEAQVDKATLLQETERLKIELLNVNPNVVMPLGAEPLRALCSLESITKWRGSVVESKLLPGMKCVPSVHTTWIISGMWKWKPVFTYMNIKRAISQSAFPEIKLPLRVAHTGPSFNMVMEYLDESSEKGEHICFDIETAYWSKSRPGEIACFGIGHSPNEALCIPFIRGNGTPYWTAREECTIWKRLATVLQDKRLALIGQNLSFEYIYMWLHRIYPVKPFIDTMLLHHCIYPDWGATEDFVRKQNFDEPGHGLAFINSQYTETPYYKDDGKTWRPEFGDHALWRYNCLDVMCTLDAALKMEREAREEHQWDFYNKMYIRPFIHALRMEWFGTPINTELRSAVGVENDKRITELQKELDALVGRSFNVNSPKQVAEFLYKDRGYQAKTKFDKKTGKSKVTADRAALEFFAIKNEDRTLNVMIQLRKLMDLKSDVLNAPLDSNGYTHTHYKIGGT